MTTTQNHHSAPGLSPTQIVEKYARTYKLAQGNEPHVIHISGDWYRVNGEIVHRLILLGEITRLGHLAQKQRLMTADKSVVQRLIAKLRGL